VSHFSVYVAVPASVTSDDLEQYVDRVMDRYNEQREVEPYKAYIKDSPKDGWEFDFLVDQASKGLIEGYTADRARALAEDWPGYVALHNHYRADGNEDAYPLMGIDDEGPFEWSSRNPDSKFDYHVFAGRWTGWLQFKKDADPSDLYGCRVLDRLDRDKGWVYEPAVGAARVRAIDFQAMIDTRVKEATEEWETFRSLVDRFGRPQPFDQILAEVGDDDANAAREVYWCQPAVRGGREEAIANFRAGGKMHWFSAERFDHFLKCDDMVTWWQEAADEAISPYAMVDFEGNWHAPERMGWFGISIAEQEQSRAEFNTQTAQWVRGLPEASWLVVLDCHI
jgi:hypothetical protein